MKIEGEKFINSNSYNRMEFLKDKIIACGSEDFQKYLVPNEKKVLDDNFFKLSDDDKLRFLIKFHTFYNRLTQISQETNKSLVFGSSNGNKLIFSDSSYKEMMELLIKKYQVERECVLIDSLDKGYNYCFEFTSGESYYDYFNHEGEDMLIFELSCSYMPLCEFDFGESEQEFFYKALEMIIGKREAVVKTSFEKDGFGKSYARNCYILDGEHEIEVEPNLRNKVRKFVNKHNLELQQEQEEIKKYQMKMEGI